MVKYFFAWSGQNDQLTMLRRDLEEDTFLIVLKLVGQNDQGEGSGNTYFF